jgi:hypothetical protein
VNFIKQKQNLLTMKQFLFLLGLAMLFFYPEKLRTQSIISGCTSAASSQSPGFTAANTTDGNVSTYWKCSKEAAWVDISLPSAKAISSMLISWKYPWKNANIQLYKSNVLVNTLDLPDYSSGLTTNVDLSSYNYADKIRVNCSRYSTSSSIAINEISLKGYDSPKIAFTYNADGDRKTQSIFLSTKSCLQDSTVDSEPPKPVEGELGVYKLLVYPNPTSGFLHVDIVGSNYGNQGQVRVFNLNGKMIYSKDQIQQINDLDLSGLASGMYILQVSIGNITQDWKLIKQ